MEGVGSTRPGEPLSRDDHARVRADVEAVVGIDQGVHHLAVVTCVTVHRRHADHKVTCVRQCSVM